MRGASEEMFFLDEISELNEVVVDGGEEFGEGLWGGFALLVCVVTVAEDCVAAVDEERDFHLLE